MKAGYVQQAQEDKQRWQDEAAKLGQQIAQQQKLVDQWKGVYMPRHTAVPALHPTNSATLLCRVSAAHGVRHVYQG